MAKTGRRLTKEDVTPGMIEAGARAGWGEPDPPYVCYDIAERVYRAMEAKRHEPRRP